MENTPDLFSSSPIERQFQERTREGIVSSQNLTSFEIIEAVMREGRKRGKFWWFAYELMGFHTVEFQRYFLSYKASTRVSEMAKKGTVESRPTEGKLNLYRLLID